MKKNLNAVLLLSALFALAACQSGPGTTDAGMPADGKKSADKKNAEQHSRIIGHAMGTRSRDMFIQQHDTNQDGRVTREEYQAFRDNRFRAGDVDGKGYMTEQNYVDEYAARLEKQLEDERKGHIGQTKTRFESLDKDKDGYISRAEYQASGERMFAHLDKDKRGVIEKQENETQTPARNPSMLAMPTSHSVKGFLELYDEDADGRVTRTEFDQQREAAFRETDRNGDGRLSFDEYLEEFSARLDRQAESVRQAQLKQASVRFGAIDTNKDKRIDADEYRALGKRTFDAWDTNKDGVITTEDPLPEPRQPRRPEGNKAAEGAR